MKFLLFSKTAFEVSNPVALVECYCFQTDFYANYDYFLPNRKVEHVSSIGARIQNDVLQRCIDVTDNTKNVRIFEYGVDEFLDLDDEAISNHVREVSEVVIGKLMMIKGIGLSKATKILHTLHPHIIPMIDSMLQEEYRREIDSKWRENNPEQILFDYYKNLKEEPTRQHLANVFESVSKNIPCLTKVRVFDIIWWSYLRAKKLRDRNNVFWSTLQ